ncbi:MAG: dethiobiotin synthase [Nitrospiraceae bacterium]
MLSSSTPRGLFVVGTDTGIGKTTVTAALACHLKNQGLRIAVMKPVETGVPLQGTSMSDADYLRSAACSDDSLEVVSPYRFADALAPLAAANRTGTTIDMGRIITAFEALHATNRFVLVEGAGGVLVPVTKELTVRDLIARLGLPVLIVGRAGLGGVNHALLTIEALRQRHIAILALVLNQTVPVPAGEATLQARSTETLLRVFTPVPVLGMLEYEPALSQSWEEGLGKISQSPIIELLAGLVMKSWQ